jgi:hypothetical protein
MSQAYHGSRARASKHLKPFGAALVRIKSQAADVTQRLEIAIVRQNLDVAI